MVPPSTAPTPYCDSITLLNVSKLRFSSGIIDTSREMNIFQRRSL